ncbi:MAG TPA: MotA/TolQ/ExbB proton channel family protein [Myxococcales bacterium]|jgi:biopolymer transport protein ExbB|nr:MotA/TolQ/ExbB proton channel family protein [Myxococcales bacterium]
MGSLLDHVSEFFKEGGPFMYINLLSSAAAIAIILDRSIRLVFVYSINGAPFMEQVTKLVMTGNIDRAVKLCGAAPNAALARVIRAGLSRANRGEIEVARAVEESILEVTPTLQKRIQALWSLANIATLLGLIGTITGLIAAFRSLGAVAAEQKNLVLSKGISEAMNNTAFGLGIAVTCIVAHLFLTAKAKHMIEEIELYALKLENLLSRRTEGAEAQSA